MMDQENKKPMDLTESVPEIPDTDNAPEKKQKKRKWWLLLIFLLIAGLVLSAAADFFGTGGGKEEIPIEVTEGSGSSVIAGQLKENNIIRHPFLFKLYARLKSGTVYQKGTHYVTDSMSYPDLLEVFSSAANMDEFTRKLVIPEGFELWQIVELLVENGLGDKSTFYHEIENGVFDFPFVSQIPRTEHRLEGYLYPDTYLFTTEESEHDILNRMLTAFNEKVVPVYHVHGTEKTLDEIITFASVIEREAANDEERPLVASVFENRLKIGMKLESCATVQYILKERKTVLSMDDIAIESPYNTYLHTGLPAGPIASPGVSSVIAALTPAKTDYLYFLATADGEENLFSETFEEHNRKLVKTQK